MKQVRKLWMSLLLLFTVDTYAISIDMVHNKTLIQNGSTMAIDINISGLNNGAAPSLGAYDLDFNFDKTLFTFNQIIWGDRIKGNQLDLNNFGSLQLSHFSVGTINLFELSFDDIASLEDWQAGEFTLFSILLTATTVGEAHFSLWANNLSDAAGNSIIVKMPDELILDVVGVEVPEPSSLLLLLGCIAILVLRARTLQR
ncbi:MAG TPA: PEP-CTERM sorting domain-containing protein [Cellvibrio sp.]|nr:PEP-CTERM sorting domain-containing protein [Cellvibrio sp.]